MVVLGAQWGDEGKGKLVDVLAGARTSCAVQRRGERATLEVDGKKYAFHLLPCGMLRDTCVNVIGNGVVVHVPTLFEELKQLGDDSSLEKLVISSRAHVLLDGHRVIDGMLEAEKAGKGGALGTTKRGIGPCSASANQRPPLLRPRRRRRALWRSWPPCAPSRRSTTPAPRRRRSPTTTRSWPLRASGPLVARSVRDTVTYMADAYDGGKIVLAEGANAALLDPDFGTYPS
ncbi:adenylosuccinate synthase [Aureococcus anophagefferens]|nr:adenylosuccinate synthase [Aureococcus anophagefferens]